MTQQTPQQSLPPCYGDYTASDAECVGGSDSMGRRVPPCESRSSCRSIAATAQRANPAQTPAPAPQPQSSNRGATSPYRLPQVSAAPPSPQPPQARAAPAPPGASMVAPSPAPAGVQVRYDAVAPNISSRLPVAEPTTRRKRTRLAAEMLRAGLAASAGQFAHFVANVPFLSEKPDE